MEFPRLVFVSPGKNFCNGGTYGCELVKDAEEYEAAINAGFYGSIPEAIKNLGAKKEIVDDEHGEDESVNERPSRGRKAKQK